jgi:glutathione S-transferase
VPVLRIDEKVSLFESNAIAEYLDETTEPRLHPNDPALRAINRAWTDYVPTFANLVTAGAYADDEASYKASAENIPMAFERLELAQNKTRDRSLMAPNIRWSMPPMHRFYSGISFLIA